MPPGACDFVLGDIWQACGAGYGRHFPTNTRRPPAPLFGVVVFSCVKRLDSLFAPAQGCRRLLSSCSIFYHVERTGYNELAEIQ